MAGHKRLAPSSAHRWMNCSGCLNLIDSLGDKIQDSTNEYAAYGTTAHLIAAQCLEESREPWEFTGEAYETDGFRFTVDDAMVDCIQLYVDVVRSDLSKHGGTLHVEESGDLSGIVSADCGGTLDAGFLGADNWARIYDLKTGYGIVEPEGNEQLQIYALQFVHKMLNDNQRGVVKGVELVIVQPRAPHPDGPVRRWRVSYKALVKWMDKSLKPLAEATTEEDAKLNQGSWCKYCPAFNWCPAVDNNVDDIIAEATEVCSIESCTPGELSEILDQYPLVQDYFKRVEERIFSLMLKGTEVPGRKLVRSISRRAWKDDAEGEAPRDFFEMKFMSPAQVEKKSGKGKKFVAEWAYKPEGKLTVASVDDKRPAETPEGNDPNSTFADMI